MRVPEWAEKTIRDVGGVNELGKPNFRIVWGAERMTVMGGKWAEFDNSGNKTGDVVECRKVTKYPDFEDRWILEQYTYPEMTRDEWTANFTKNIDGQFIETMGPYPENGEYELLKVLEVKGQFVPLTSTVLDAIIHVAKINKHIPAKDRMEFSRLRREREAKAKASHKEAILQGVRRPSWALNPHVVLSQMKEGVSHG